MFSANVCKGHQGHITIEYTDRHSTQMLCANSRAIFLLVHRLFNSIRNTVLRCYTDRHNTVITVKGSTLDRASDGRDGHGGFRHGVICQLVAKPGAVSPFFWSGKAHVQERNTHLQSCSIASWRSRSCLPFFSRGLPSAQGSFWEMRNKCPLTDGDFSRGSAKAGVYGVNISCKTARTVVSVPGAIRPSLLLRRSQSTVRNWSIATNPVRSRKRQRTRQG